MKNYYCGIGWRYDIPTFLDFYEEIAYSLASMGYVLRATPNPGGSNSFIRGVERYCEKRKVPLEDRLEVYLPSEKYNSHIGDQVAHLNIKKSHMYEKALALSKYYGDIDDAFIKKETEFRALSPFLCFGQELNAPLQFLITGIPLFKLNAEDQIIDGQGFTGEMIRTIRGEHPKTEVFSYNHPEHRRRINKLVYMK